VQCYALQHVLQNLGHEAIVLQREFNRQYTVKGACVYYAKHVVKLLLGRRSSWHYYISQKRRDFIAQNTYTFTEKYITPISTKCYTTEQLAREVESLRLDAIIVGSDQVWRPYYSPCQPNYFLDFLPENSAIKRISYAASFGGDEWQFTSDMDAQFGRLLKKFCAVSVREQSGIDLCKEHFGVTAVQTLDPTMLLEQDDYRRLVGNTKRYRGNLFCYVLDSSAEKENVIRTIADQSANKVFTSMPELCDSAYNLYGDLARCVYPPVENWLSAFMEADMVVTDSFHGTVFSIIFNKPFWVVGNADRGMARFNSLLSLFGLENRLITAASARNTDFNTPINWIAVNQKRKELQAESFEFLKSALK
jgi:hypothetical protein